jgi:hypothetical protein
MIHEMEDYRAGKNLFASSQPNCWQLQVISDEDEERPTPTLRCAPSVQNPTAAGFSHRDSREFLDHCLYAWALCWLDT